LGGTGEKTSLETFRIITVFEHLPVIVANQQYRGDKGRSFSTANALKFTE
jgi:hypothetical protein